MPYSGSGLISVENAEMFTSMFGGDGTEEIKKINGNVYAAVGSLGLYAGWFDAGFSEGKMAGSSDIFDLSLYDVSITNGVVNVPESEESGSLIMNGYRTVVFLKDGRVFCQSRAEITDDGKTGSVTMRFMLVPDPEGGE